MDTERRRPASAHTAEPSGEAPHRTTAAESRQDGGHRPLWTVESAPRPRLPDPVRTSAVRAVIIGSVTLILAMIAFLCTLAASWFAFPAVLATVGGTVVATWSVVDVWVTRQVWNQRYGVVSAPSSTARALRRERRRARRAARTAAKSRSRPADRRRLSQA
ncbi:hypothetical protein [Streptomyces sp. bgisy100]|uniref:hypothetical protein n=1 Tax=Streptomyces sp. bgisy100 TaxID=3413783 RepID=UPI003D733ABC